MMLVALLGLTLLTGCSGLGLHKQVDMMPDEVWVVTDLDPQESGRLSEISGGMKWKLK